LQKEEKTCCPQSRGDGCAGCAPCSGGQAGGGPTHHGVFAQIAVCGLPGLSDDLFRGDSGGGGKGILPQQEDGLIEQLGVGGFNNDDLTVDALDHVHDTSFRSYCVPKDGYIFSGRDKKGPLPSGEGLGTSI